MPPGRAAWRRIDAAHPGAGEIRTLAVQRAHTRRPATHREPPLSNPRTVLPLLAGIALMALLWLAFHDGSVDLAHVRASPAPATAPVARAH